MEALLSGLVGAVVGAGIGAFVTLRVQDRVDQADRRRQAAEILGRLRAFIDDHSLDPWAFNASDESVDLLEERRTEWRILRPQVLTLRALYPEQASEVEEIYMTCDNMRVEITNVVRSPEEQQ